MNFNEVKELISMVDSSGFKNFELTLDNCNVKMRFRLRLFRQLRYHRQRLPLFRLRRITR